MRLTFEIPARVIERTSGAEVRAPDSLDGWKTTDELLSNYLDTEIADAGVIGGETQAIVRDGRAALRVTFWAPGPISDELAKRLQADMVAQLDDGIGEGGFEFKNDQTNVYIIAISNMAITLEQLDDERIIPSPSRIAIAARDGDMKAVLDQLRHNSAIDGLHQGYSGLQLAILYGHPDVATALLKAGANSNLLDPQGSSPLELCALSNSLSDEQSCQVAQVLLEHGADPTRITPNGESVRTYAELRHKSNLSSMFQGPELVSTGPTS